MKTSFLNGKQILVWSAGLVVAGEIIYRWFQSKKEKKTEPFLKVLFFPDNQVACKTHFTQRHGCMLQRCRFSHDPQSSYAQLLWYFKNVRHRIDLCVYMITCLDLAEVIVDLHSKGVIVRIITDNKEIDASGSQIGRFRMEGIQVRHNASSYLMHHKFVVIDGQLLITGSFNWTRQAITGNCENLIVSDQPDLVTKFSQEFSKLWEAYDPQEQVGQSCPK